MEDDKEDEKEDCGLKLIIWSGWQFTPVLTVKNGRVLGQLKHRQKRRLAECGVIKILNDLAPALVIGSPDPAINDATIQAILQAIEFRQPGYRLKHCRNFFVQGLDRGVKAGLWQVHVPAPVMTVSRQKALFQPQSMAALPNLRQIQAALQKTWSDPLFFEAADPYLTRLKSVKGIRADDALRILRAGQLLLTALLYGGLLAMKYLCLLPRHVDQLKTNPTCSWIDFIEVQAMPPESHTAKSSARIIKAPIKAPLFQRRWFPDSVTELLLLRWHIDQLGAFPVLKGLRPEHGERYCQSLIQAFGVAVGLGENRMPLRALISSAETASALVLPAFLIHFATGKIATTSLPPHAWQRLYSNQRGDPVIPILDTSREDIPLPGSAALICDEQVIQRYDQYRLYKTLASSLSLQRTDPRRPHAQSIQIIEAFIRTHLDQLAPGLFRLCQWAITLYRGGSVGQSRLAASTVTLYVGQLKELIHVIGHDDPLALEGEELLDIYQDLIDRCKTPKAKVYKAGRIKEFHHYLCTCGYNEPLNLAELEDVKPLGANVDANFINETAYQRTLAELKCLDASHPRYVTSRRLITVLGYRCGLRRTEAWKLRMCDIQLGPYPVLFVRASRQKTVKSSHATRQLPLTALLTPAELKELLQWLDYRRTEQGLYDFQTDDSFVFCHDHHGLSLIQESLIFPIIQTVLRSVTGDKTVRYHHLRHSFANQVLLRLHANGAEWANGQPPAIECSAAADALFGLNQRQPSRKQLYQVATLLGHASPEMTLRSYIHCCDYLLRHHLNQAYDSTVSVDTITTLSGIGREALYKKRQRHYPDWSVLDIAKQQLRNQIPDHEPTTEKIDQDTPIEWPESLPSPFSQSQDEEPTLAMLLQLIEHYDPEQRNAIYWSEKTGYPAQTIQAWMDAAVTLSHMKTGKGAPRHIRPQWWGLQDTNQKNTRQFHAQFNPPRCMPELHQRSDRQDAQHVLQKLKVLKLNDPAMADWGIQLFIETSVASRSHLRVKTVEIAQRYKAFIQALGFPIKRIHAQLKPQSRPGSPSPEEQVQYWSKALSIPPQQISLISKMEKRGPQYGSLRMTVINNKGNASYGFRYALYMAAILMLAGVLKNDAE